MIKVIVADNSHKWSMVSGELTKADDGTDHGRGLWAGFARVPIQDQLEQVAVYRFEEGDLFLALADAAGIMHFEVIEK